MLNSRIIYPNDTGGINIVIPAPEWTGTIEQLTAKDVPFGIPYKIVDTTEVPSDRTNRDIWQEDFNSPDGYGGAR